MVKSSQDLWISPTTPLGVAAEDAGSIGDVCGTLGADAKKSVWWFWLFSRSTFWARSRAQLREPVHIKTHPGWQTMRLLGLATS